MPYIPTNFGYISASVKDPVAYRQAMANQHRRWAQISRSYAPKRYKTKIWKGKKRYFPYK